MAEGDDAEALFEARWQRMQSRMQAARDEAKQLKEANRVLHEDEARHRAEADDLETRFSLDEGVLEDARDTLVLEVDDLATRRVELQDQKAAIEYQLAANQNALDSSTTSLSKAEHDLKDYTRTRKVAIRKSRKAADESAASRERNEARIQILVRGSNTVPCLC